MGLKRQLHQSDQEGQFCGDKRERIGLINDCLSSCQSYKIQNTVKVQRK